MPVDSIWKGSVSFGLVNVPVEMRAAIRDRDLHFHELHEPDGARIRHVRFCAAEGKPVKRKEIGRGYELDNGEMIVLTDEELDSVGPEKTHTIEIESFVKLAQIDPIYFDRPYFLTPGNDNAGTLRAYRLLVEALDRNGRVALGRFVLRSREYLAAIRERDGVMALSTLRYADEVRSTDQFPSSDTKPEEEAVENALAVIDELTTEWNPAGFEDCYRERLESVVESKAKGKTIEAPEPAEESATPAPDLMAALKKTLDQSKAKNRKGVKALEKLNRKQLYERARKAKIRGRSEMDKAELLKALSSD